MKLQKNKNCKNNFASIIIRTKNEERWISSCLDAVFNQEYKDFEVILVDNQSTDQTIEKAKKYPIHLVSIKDFLPGKAINMGISKSSGKIIVVLSGHCIPVTNKWLENLIHDLEDPKVAGVYGRQEPMSFSSDNDKRDLVTVFGLDKKIHRYFPDFWIKYKNAQGNILCEVIEVKPKRQTQKPTKKNKPYGKYLKESRTYGINQLKWKAAREYCADRNYKFRILTEDHLVK